MKNVLKAGITMTIIGLALGVIVPALAGLAGPELLGEAVFTHLDGTSALQTGIFFGAFGAVSAVVTPAVNYIFGERQEKTVTAKTLGVRSRTLGYEQAPDPSQAQSASPQLASSTHFQDMIAAQKAASLGKPPTIT